MKCYVYLSLGNAVYRDEELQREESLLVKPLDLLLVAGYVDHLTQEKSKIAGADCRVIEVRTKDTNKPLLEGIVYDLTDLKSDFKYDSKGIGRNSCKRSLTSYEHPKHFQRRISARIRTKENCQVYLSLGSPLISLGENKVIPVQNAATEPLTSRQLSALARNTVKLADLPWPNSDRWKREILIYAENEEGQLLQRVSYLLVDFNGRRYFSREYRHSTITRWDSGSSV